MALTGQDAPVTENEVPSSLQHRPALHYSPPDVLGQVVMNSKIDDGSGDHSGGRGKI